MKKLLLLLVSIVMIFTLASCGDPEIVGYHIDENGKLIATYDDDTTVDLGTLTDTIANGVNTITINDDGYYVINGVVSKIEAKLPESYSIDTDGNLIVTYTDTTTENLGKFGNDAINTIDTIAISDDGFYVLNGIKTSIVAVDVFEVKFVTGYDATVKTQIIKDGDKVERPQLERAGYTLKGWSCNGEEWRFNSDVVLSEMTLTAEWIANDYTVSFNTGISDTLPNQTITFGSEYLLPTLERTGYTFKGWEHNGKLVTANKWDITENATLVAKWEVNKYTVTLNASGGTVAQQSVKVTYGEEFTLPVATNEYGAFIGWFYGETQITDSQGNSLENWTYLTDIEATTSWTIKLSNANDLQQLYLYPNGHFELTQSIDISLTEWVPVGTDSKPFTGEINGCGFAINGLKITSLQDNLQAYGFIGIAKGGKIYDISFTNINISLPAIQNTVYVGGVIGYNEGAALDKVLTSGTITIANHSSSFNSYAGGIVGYTLVDDISNCENRANITAKTVAGGIIGYKEATAELNRFIDNNNSGTISANIAGGIIGDGVICMVKNSANTGNITGVSYAGGIIGRSDCVVRVDRCKNEGKIVTNSTTPNLYEAAGGIVGTIVIVNTDYYNLTSSIANSYNTGEISSVHEAGGILGATANPMTKIDIENCYNSGLIKGEYYTGGIAGIAFSASIRQCANFGTISKGELRATITYIVASVSTTITDCYYNCSTSGINAIQGTKTTDLYSKDFYTQSMFWSDDIWNFYVDKLPTLK